ncbi:MAG: ferrochelatase [Flavobacteriales bacterium]|nr:ferrochelatase [Flavobacteriales bacterium]MBL6873373.1 ferrochelatase [Flavobacteriales bacterium]
MTKKKAVLLVNLGTPDSPKTSDVRSYLFQFLNDKRVIDIPWLLRKILVNGIIVPFRAPKSAKVYKELWTERGSPIVYHTDDLTNKLKEELGEEYHVEYAMRYKNPSLRKTLESWENKNFEQIIILPLFPHYASATNGSVIEEAMDVIRKWWVIPELSFVTQFYDHEFYLKGFEEQGNKHNFKEYDHILFSFHGLPERHVDKVYDEGLCQDNDCEQGVTEANQFCYKATCYETAIQLAKRFKLKKEDYSVGFQSRLGRGWIEPFSDKIIEDLGKNGAKKILVFSPAFVADCLETTIEIGDEYQELFEEFGGEKVQLVESLNSSDSFVQGLKEMIVKRSI